MRPRPERRAVTDEGPACSRSPDAGPDTPRSVIVLAAAPSPLPPRRCPAYTAAFPPGTWTAGGISFTHDISDGFSAGVIEDEAGFTLEVDELGQVSGDYSAVFSGSLEAIAEDTSGEATIVSRAARRHRRRRCTSTARRRTRSGRRSTCRAPTASTCSRADRWRSRTVDLHRPVHDRDRAELRQLWRGDRQPLPRTERPMLFIATRASSDQAVDVEDRPR